VVSKIYSHFAVVRLRIIEWISYSAGAHDAYDAYHCQYIVARRNHARAHSPAPTPSETTEKIDGHRTIDSRYWPDVPQVFPASGGYINS
jgi:hypothetical protein